MVDGKDVGTGKIPFTGTTMMEILNRHMFEVPDVKHPNIPDEVGAISGELELLTRPKDAGVEALVRYAGSRDLYTVTGSPVRSNESHEQTHEIILQRLTAPGGVENGNELPVDLADA